MRFGILQKQERTDIGRYLHISDALTFLIVVVTGAIFNLCGNTSSVRKMFNICLRGVIRLLKLFLRTLKFISSYPAFLFFAKEKKIDFKYSSLRNICLYYKDSVLEVICATVSRQLPPRKVVPRLRLRFVLGLGLDLGVRNNFPPGQLS